MEPSSNNISERNHQRSFYHPPEPPSYYREFRAVKNGMDSEGGYTKGHIFKEYNGQRNIKRANIFDHAVEHVQETGTSKKEKFHQSIQNMKNKNMDGPPYRTLQPEEKPKNVSNIGGKYMNSTNSKHLILRIFKVDVLDI